jgi:hypothetical protein
MPKWHIQGCLRVLHKRGTSGQTRLRFQYVFPGQSWWIQKATPQGKSLQVPHGWRISQETQKWQVQPGTVWSFGPRDETLAGTASTKSLHTCWNRMFTLDPPHPVTLNIRFSSGPWKVSVSPLLFATATVHLIVNRNACTRLQRAVKLVKAVSRRCKGCIKDQSRLN